MMDDMDAFERQLAGVICQTLRPPRPVDVAAIVEATTARTARWSVTRRRLRIGGQSAPRDGGSTLFSALKIVAAALIVALFGGLLLKGVISTQRGAEMAPAAPAPPSPVTTEGLLSTMVTEEVEPGVYRLLHDGVRDLTPAEHWGVFAGQDGSIWLVHGTSPSRLGVADDGTGQLGGSELMDLEVAPDGTVWVVVVTGDESTLRSFDGETWTTQRAVESRIGLGNVEITSDGVVWAALGDGSIGHLDADGSTWQTIDLSTYDPEVSGWDWWNSPIQGFGFGFVATESELWAPHFGGGAWHYADGAWEHITYGDPDIGTWPDEVFWGLGGGTSTEDEILHRHDATGWRQWSLREYDMKPGGWHVGRSYAAAPDGSLWARWSTWSEEDDPCQGVGHFDGQTWVRYLPGMCIAGRGMAIATDGSVWVLAFEGKGEWNPLARSPGHLYVITPEAIAASR